MAAQGLAWARRLKRPSVIGHYPNDFVYAPIAPEVLPELRKKNPTLAPGQQPHTHPQGFTPAFGHPRVREPIAGVVALMRVTPGMPSSVPERAYPVKNKEAPWPLEYANNPLYTPLANGLPCLLATLFMRIRRSAAR